MPQETAQKTLSFPEIRSIPYISSLIIIILNDHYLKTAGIAPAWLTGKISDFAGLFLFPIFVLMIIRLVFYYVGKSINESKALIIILILTGAIFGAANLSSDFSGFLSGLLSITNVVDPTDCVAIIMLPLVYFWWRKL